MRFWVLLALAVGLAATLRLVHLGAESVWLDEAASVQIARDPPVDVVLDATQDVHPPLYYLTLHFWMRIVGDSERAIRALSVVLSLVALLAGAAFARTWFGARTALVAALLAAISPLQIAFAQEARMYALLALTALLSMAGLLRLLWTGERRALAWFVVASTALLYTHAYAAFVLAGEAVWLAAALVARPAHRAVWWRRGGLGFGLVALGYLPWLPAFLGQLHQVEHAFWIPPNATLAEAVVAQAGSVPLAWLLAALGLGALVVTWRESAANAAGARTWAAATLAATVGLAVITLPFALSRVSTPIFLPKYTIAASLGLLTLGAHGLARLPSRLLRAGLAAALCLLTAVPLHRYFTTRHKGDWRSVVQAVDAAAAPGDVVLFSQAFGQAPYEYYARRTDVVELPFLDVRDGLTDRSLVALARVAIAPHDRVWLVETDPDAATAALVRSLAGYAVAERVGDRARGVQARLYVRTAPTR